MSYSNFVGWGLTVWPAPNVYCFTERKAFLAGT